MAKGVAGQGVEGGMGATAEEDKVKVYVDIQVVVHEDEVANGDVIGAEPRHPSKEIVVKSSAASIAGRGTGFIAKNGGDKRAVRSSIVVLRIRKNSKTRVI